MFAVKKEKEKRGNESKGESIARRNLPATGVLRSSQMDPSFIDYRFQYQPYLVSTMFSRYVANLLAVLLLPLVSAASLSLIVRSTALLPNPNTLPPSTSATLTDLGRAYTAPLQRDNRFTFRNISAGSYLLDVHCRDYVFAPLRLDVSSDDKVEAWQTFRGHEWDNKGEKSVERPVELKVLGGKDYYEQRSGCKWCIEFVVHGREI